MVGFWSRWAASDRHSKTQKQTYVCADLYRGLWQVSTLATQPGAPSQRGGADLLTQQDRRWWRVQDVVQYWLPAAGAPALDR